MPGTASAAVPSLSAALPVDPAVRIGTLPNGLRYYIRKNSRPEKRAELRLVVNVGSIVESESQLGYAHFIEHMAFNGTTHFHRNDLVAYLQSIGVRFGADLNAATSFDETVYILPVPTDTARIVDRAFTILEDWAHGQLFDSSEVVAERGVVHEEWRASKGAGMRMLDKWLPIALAGSLYAKRLPIGTETSIMTATPSRLREFYREWYRPELMAVIAVGDFDPAAIETEIKSHFAGIPRKANVPARTSPAVPANKLPIVAISSDKEASGTSVDLLFKMPRQQTRTLGDYRRDLTAQLYLQMLNSRLSETAQQNGAPFLGASAGRSGFLARDLVPFSLSAHVVDGGIRTGLKAVLAEAARVDQFGFLQSELDRARANRLRSDERTYAERLTTPSAAFANEYIRNFLIDEPIPGIPYEHEIGKSLLPTITLADVNRLAASWVTDTNRVVIIQSPDKEGASVPTVAEILGIMDQAAKAPVVAYKETLGGDPLLTDLPRPGSIASSSAIPAAGVFEWKLSNGVRVLVKPTDFRSDEILMAASRPGGTSVAPNEDFLSASLSAQIVGASGLGNFNRVDLGKKLAGKAVGVAPTVTETTEGISGQSSPSDLETLLQLTYLFFTGARLDTNAFTTIRNNTLAALANRGSNPEEVFRDTIQVTMAQHDFRARALTPAIFGEVNAEKALRFFKSRFSDASGFTFVFVGNVDSTTFKPLVERYLASLPVSLRTDTLKFARAGPPRGVLERTVLKGSEPKAHTVMDFTGVCAFNPETRFAIRALTEVLQLRLVQTLREKLGGTYSPGVGGACARLPRQEYSLAIQFVSSPENVEPLTAATLALVDTLKSVGPTSADIEKVKEEFIRAREVELKQNAYWVASILGRDQAGEDMIGFLAPYDALIKNLTADQVREAAKKYLDSANYARFVLRPETK